MDVSLSAWLVILLAVLAANIPFFNERVFALVSLKAGKPLWMRLLELLVLYFLVLGAGWLLEARLGNVFAQTWEFYVVTACLFLVFAFPGFVWRYLRRRRD